jgi:hypothetical protein|eukprot:COSAG01_NODE_43697_length_427_cov_0.798780_1_plen_67_part_00
MGTPTPTPSEEVDPFEDEVDDFLAETLAAEEAEEAAHEATRRVVELAEDATIPQTVCHSFGVELRC